MDDNGVILRVSTLARTPKPGDLGAVIENGSVHFHPELIERVYDAVPYTVRQIYRDIMTAPSLFCQRLGWEKKNVIRAGKRLAWQLKMHYPEKYESII